MSAKFDYTEAFSRNIGWVTPAEQETLRDKRVAIAGMGGVGGVHLLTLARLGIGRFSIADFDTFDLVNFNRQVGATMSSLGRPKLAVLEEMVRDINPEVDLRLFPEGAKPDQMDEFLSGCDVYVDGLDFFAFTARRSAFASCERLGIPAVTAAPLGMSVAWLTFLPGQMSFEEYFQLEGCSEDEMALRLFLGLAPAGLHGACLVDPSKIDLKNRRGPSTIIACQLCAGVVGAEVCKILTGRGPVLAAPSCQQFDAFTGMTRESVLPQGNSTQEQRLRLQEMRKVFGLPDPSSHEATEAR
ncbi:MAG: ThiF family adenylyltransferase [Zoogloeaceae bacterium]|nr:ThiF family adenylyltransferase [Zoogloeaceae bacterium]